MDGNTLSAIIGAVVVNVLLLVPAAFLLKGKGAWMIAGYNASSQEEKAKWNTTALCKAVGRLVIAILVCVDGGAIAIIQGYSTIFIITMVLAVGITIAAIVYINTSKKFKT